LVLNSSFFVSFIIIILLFSNKHTATNTNNFQSFQPQQQSFIPNQQQTHFQPIFQNQNQNQNQNHSSSPSSVDIEKMSYMMWHAAKAGDLELVKNCIDKGADVNWVTVKKIAERERERERKKERKKERKSLKEQKKTKITKPIIDFFIFFVIFFIFSLQ